MNHIFRLYLILVLIITSLNSYGQDFKIFVLLSRYNTADVNYMTGNKTFDKYYWIGRSTITPKRNGIIDEGSIKQRLQLYFPNIHDTGVLSIDIEGEIMENLKKYKLSDSRFKKSEEFYLKVIKIIKNYRPNVKVGIYGLPFRYFDKVGYKVEDDIKLNKVFKAVDYISPSLYIKYPKKEKGLSFNMDYLSWHLDRSIKISTDYNIDLFPYVWHVVHPVNRKYGGRRLDKDELVQYIKYIKNYRKYNSQVSGILWWEEPQNSQYSFLKIQGLSPNKVNAYSYYNIIIDVIRDLN